MVYLQKFSDDAHLACLIPRLEDQEIQKVLISSLGASRPTSTKRSITGTSRGPTTFYHFTLYSVPILPIKCVVIGTQSSFCGSLELFGLHEDDQFFLSKISDQWLSNVQDISLRELRAGKKIVMRTKANRPSSILCHPKLKSSEKPVLP
jgi:hypothetical protein